MKKAPLTPLEVTIMNFVAAGLSNPEIALEINHSKHTISSYFYSICQKRNWKNRTIAALCWSGIDVLAALDNARNLQSSDKSSKLLDIVSQDVSIYAPSEWHLTRHELEVLSLLCRRQIVSREAIHFALYGLDPNGGPDISCVDGIIHRLRKKLCLHDVTIDTIFSVGYSISENIRSYVRIV